ncbi:hypothetical protein HMPREF7215_1498 [Pyramidobacter piscolens W5455]|uniref:Uncharacterized protein n=1 Tax=Pyramidobacter piscolens W5455 TaxID=352165 RepID=A0ABP2HWF9_9BACT|nr:hypothetical protein HMPREF7215_1498 [Pyramidobacter piscolens W5455]
MLSFSMKEHFIPHKYCMFLDLKYREYVMNHDIFLLLALGFLL